jgi:hypothetical protein
VEISTAADSALGGLAEVRHMKKVKDTPKKAKPKKPIQNKEAGKLDKVKITGLPGYTPGELPKR